jgi:UV radiation resistance-associated gene protein
MNLLSTDSGRHTTLLASIAPVRATLLQTVSSIFPIEPIEPKDLLFGILSVPLPIPIGANDPAPPLTLPGDSSYNDETLATALGFVAQLVNLVTAYLGDLPAYPVVCQGSRSVVKDPISAMMGPRSYVLLSPVRMCTDSLPASPSTPVAWMHTDSNMVYFYSTRILN